MIIFILNETNFTDCFNSCSMFYTLKEAQKAMKREYESHSNDIDTSKDVIKIGEGVMLREIHTDRFWTRWEIELFEVNLKNNLK